MDVPEEWRPRPMIRVWGLPAAATEAELWDLIESQGVGLAVHSVVFDPKQTTQAGKVALVRFQPPPLPGEANLDSSGAATTAASPAAAATDVGKVAESIITALRAKQLELHGQNVNVEKTAAEVGTALAVCACRLHHAGRPEAVGCSLALLRR